VALGAITSCLHPKAANKNVGYDMERRVALFHVGRKPLDALDDLRALYYEHFAQLRFGALGCASAQVTLAAFGADDLPGTRQAKTLGRCLVGL